MEVGVGCAVEIHLGRSAGIVIEEMQIVIANGHMSNQFAMKKVIGRSRYAIFRDDLLRAQSVEIVFEFDFLVGFAHLLDLSAGCPFIRPSAIVQRIADCVVGNGSAIARSQFVFSAAVAIGVRNRLNRGTQRTSGVSILRLAGDAAAVVVGILERDSVLGDPSKVNHGFPCAGIISQPRRKLSHALRPFATRFMASLSSSS